MILKPPDIDEVRQIAQEDANGLRSLSFDGLSLGAALELACCCRQWEQQRNGAAQIARHWAESLPQLKQAQAALAHRGFQAVPHEQTHGAPEWEICSAPLASQLGAPDWILFQSRFTRSLCARSFPRTLALALSKSLGEMADNIPRHSTLSQDAPAAGVVGYHVGHRSMTFAVADMGQGVLSSLRQNPRWASLKTSTQALQKAVQENATSQLDEDEGDGFRQVLSALSDLNGLLRFRSGDGVLAIDGRGQGRRGTGSWTPHLAGLQLCVSCSLENNPSLDEL